MEIKFIPHSEASYKLVKHLSYPVQMTKCPILEKAITQQFIKAGVTIKSVPTYLSLN